MELVDVIAFIPEESDLPTTLLEGRKIRGFRAGLDPDKRPSSSYRLPIGEPSADILVDIDDRISSSTAGMCSKKVSKLLPYPGMWSRRYYCFEGEGMVKFQSLPRHMTELAGMHSFVNLSKTDVVSFSLLKWKSLSWWLSLLLRPPPGWTGGHLLQSPCPSVHLMRSRC